MKRVLFICLLFNICCQVSAQSFRQQQDPNRGSFYVTKNTGTRTEKINVNFVIAPGVYTNVLTLDMNTPDPMGLSCKITDKNGTEMSNWMPQVSNVYQHSFDISNFKAGKYKINIYTADGSKVYTINFEKQS
jgi:hypothetical protein